MLILKLPLKFNIFSPFPQTNKRKTNKGRSYLLHQKLLEDMGGGLNQGYPSTVVNADADAELPASPPPFLIQNGKGRRGRQLSISRDRGKKGVTSPPKSPHPTRTSTVGCSALEDLLGQCNRCDYLVVQFSSTYLSETKNAYQDTFGLKLLYFKNRACQVCNGICMYRISGLCTHKSGLETRHIPQHLLQPWQARFLFRLFLGQMSHHFSDFNTDRPIINCLRSEFFSFFGWCIILTKKGV